MRRSPLLLAAATLVTVATLAPAAAAAAPAAAPLAPVTAPAAAAATPAYDVNIRRTENGIPHIQAADYGSLGYGYAYAFAQDNLCTMAEQYVTVDAQRSLFFGPDKTYAQRGNGTAPTNLNSDVFWQQVIDDGRVERLVAEPAPQGLKPEVKLLLSGYVAGWNRYLADVGGSAGVPDATCRGAEWVRPISEATAYRRFYQLTLLASQGVAIDGIGSAQPPTPSAPTQAALDPAVLSSELGERFKALAIGSNAVAVGKAGTTDGHGLLLGNPHFPWLGTERFYQAHLTIPGQLDVAGASLYGVPLILIGHTANMAWSHTVSTAFRFTPYQLTLDPSNSTRYLYDNASVAMTKRTVTVRTGPTTSVTRTLYATRFGPIFNGLLGLPFPWTQGEAFAMRDANDLGLGALMNHFLDTNRAQSAAEELAILKKYQGIPWVNTIVADRGGDALYADIGAVPNVTDAQAQTCASPLGVATFAALGLPTLDGSRKACEWGTDADSPRPGLFGASKMPSLLRSDYVTNSNDSFWLTNPAAPITGIPRIIGDVETARSLRTRIGLIMVKELTDKAGFTRQKMQDLVFNDRQYAGELVRTDLVALCRSMNGTAPTSGGGTVALGTACDVLAAWDLREDPASKGAILFRRFWTRAQVSASVRSVPPFVVQFDKNDPVNTPRQLNTASPQVRMALGDAVADLNGAKVALDAPLSGQQFTLRGTERIPVPGGPGGNGQFNAIAAGWSATTGVTPPLHGSSFVQVVTWHDATGCPDTATILTYSQSTNPDSPFYADQSRMFANKQWVTERFCEADVAANTVSSMRLSAAGAGDVPAPVVPEAPYAALLALAALGVLGGGVVLTRRRRA